MPATGHDMNLKAQAFQNFQSLAHLHCWLPTLKINQEAIPESADGSYLGLS